MTHSPPHPQLSPSLLRSPTGSENLSLFYFFPSSCFKRPEAQKTTNFTCRKKKKKETKEKRRLTPTPSIPTPTLNLGLLDQGRLCSVFQKNSIKNQTSNNLKTLTHLSGMRGGNRPPEVSAPSPAQLLLPPPTPMKPGTQGIYQCKLFLGPKDPHPLSYPSILGHTAQPSTGWERSITFPFCGAGN